jgi:sulfur carrier protein
MKLIVNGTAEETTATTLAGLLDALGYGGAKVATAVNEEFVPAAMRAGKVLAEGDRVEILTPRQGG